jgi:hypothetical protein
MLTGGAGILAGGNAALLIDRILMYCGYSACGAAKARGSSGRSVAHSGPSATSSPTNPALSGYAFGVPGIPALVKTANGEFSTMAMTE